MLYWFVNNTKDSKMTKKVNLANLSLEQQDIYKVFKKQYPLFKESSKALFLKCAYLMAQYQIFSDSSDNSLLELLPPEPALPTALQIAVNFYQDGYSEEKFPFRVLLPFIIYDLADPKSGRLPQCDQPNNKKLNAFESIIADTRECIADLEAGDEDLNMCKKLVLSKIIVAFYDKIYGKDNTYGQIAASAQHFLDITDFADLSTAGGSAVYADVDQDL